MAHTVVMQLRIDIEAPILDNAVQGDGLYSEFLVIDRNAALPDTALYTSQDALMLLLNCTMLKLSDDVFDLHTKAVVEDIETINLFIDSVEPYSTPKEEFAYAGFVLSDENRAPTLLFASDGIINRYDTTEFVTKAGFNVKQYDFVCVEQTGDGLNLVYDCGTQGLQKLRLEY